MGSSSTASKTMLRKNVGRTLLVRLLKGKRSLLETRMMVSCITSWQRMYLHLPPETVRGWFLQVTDYLIRGMNLSGKIRVTV